MYETYTFDHLSDRLHHSMRFADPDVGDLADLRTRQQTFQLWPVWAAVSPLDMADSGLYYTGNGDCVRCFTCQRTFANWIDGDSPTETHRRLSPDCPFVNERMRSRKGVNGSGGRGTASPYRTDGGAFSCHRGNGIDMDGLEEDRPHTVCRSEQSEMRMEPAFVRTVATEDTRPAVAVASPASRPRIDKKAVQAENARLRRAITCHKCNAEKVQTLFLPCRHLVSCEACAESMDDCIECGHKILGTVRTFML